MKKILCLICSLVFVNVLLAQTTFVLGDLTYEIIASNKVSVIACDTSATIVNVPSSVNYGDESYDVEKIGNEAFQYRTNLTTITIEEGVVGIGDKAFYYCFNLITINIPNSIITIGNSAFQHCGSLSSITIPNGLTSIGDYAFAGTDYNFLHSNPDFTSIVIPNTVTYIGKGAFAYCDKLVSVVFEQGSTITSFASIEDWESLGTFKGCSALTSIQLPQNLAAIEKHTFADCSSLTNIDIPQSVSYIAKNAFKDCDSLSIIDLVGIDSIAENAFSNCDMLSEIYLSDDVKIDSNAFVNVGAKNIGGLTYSADLNVNVGNYTFNNIGEVVSFYINSEQYTTSFEDVYVIDCEDNKTGEVVILDSVEYLGINYPVVDIGRRDSVLDATYVPFANCRGITSLVIGNNISKIKYKAFNQCTGLRSLIVGKKITILGQEAFYSCEGLTTVKTLTTTPPTLGHNTFNYNVDTLIVPCGTYDNYMSSPWNNYWDPIVFYNTVIEETAITTTIEATIEEGETYSEFGFNESQAGTYTQTFTAENGCDSIVTLNLYVNVSIDDTEFLKEVSFYPNPTSGQITFNKAIERIEVINQLGNVVMKFTNTNTINIETLSKGVYFLRLEDKGNILTRKIILQ